MGGRRPDGGAGSKQGSAILLLFDWKQPPKRKPQKKDPPANLGAKSSEGFNYPVNGCLGWSTYEIEIEELLIVVPPDVDQERQSKRMGGGGNYLLGVSKTGSGELTVSVP